MDKKLLFLVDSPFPDPKLNRTDEFRAFRPLFSVTKQRVTCVSETYGAQGDI